MRSILIKLLAVVFLYFNFLSQSYSQHETDNWFFGRRVGLSFSDKKIIPLYNSPIYQIEGTASISDPKTGKLLFYSNGIYIWNANHEIMPNGQNLSGSQTSTQSALIVPAPDQKDQYYLFTVKAYNEEVNQGGLYYSIVDMSLRQGLGDVVNGKKNILLERFTTEKLTAIPHANGIDYWIISHIWNSSDFIIYSLTTEGLSKARQITIGTHHLAGPVGLSEAMGYLKASPNNKLLASAVYGDGRPFELYSFNNRTGDITNYKNLGNFTGQYGVSFSPDNSKLYLSCFGDGFYQFDLSEESPSFIMIPLIDTLTNGVVQEKYIEAALELGIDGKLYGATELGRIAVINYPNLKGKLCDVKYLNVDFKDSRPLEGLPNFIQSIFNESPIVVEPDTLNECGQDLNVYPNPVTNDLQIQLGSSKCALVNIILYDISGRELLIYNSLPEKSFRLDTRNWGPAQTYILVFNYEGKRIVRKIIKM